MKYFTIKELSKSSTANQLKIDNTPNEEQANNLVQLVENILDPLREAWGRPIIVNSAFRGQTLNAKVGGAKTSQHLTGQAADITVGNPEDNKKLFNLVQDLKLPFDQLIDEYGFKWIHVSYSPRNRRQILHIK